MCATRGEAGQISDPVLAKPETLGQVREEELRTAARIMGVHDLTLLDYRDGTLAEVDPIVLTGKVVRVIRRVRPQVVVTFDAKGGYGHPDHLAVHHATVAAFEQADDPACYPEQIHEGLEPFAPERLYANAFSRSVMARIREEMRAIGADYRPGGNAATIPIEEMGARDDEITVTIPLTDEEFKTKVQALLSHRTQIRMESSVRRLPEAALREWLGTERFIQLIPLPATGGPVERGLFGSLDPLEHEKTISTGR
jgi:LmbE family N-acetylglucosaminyl deacetylase